MYDRVALPPYLSHRKPRPHDSPRTRRNCRRWSSAAAADFGRVEALEVQTRSKATQDITLSATVGWASGRDPMAMSTSGYSHEDLVEVGIRTGLLHEATPERLTGIGMSSLVDSTDPPAELQRIRIPEGSVGPIARLLVAEQLIGGRRAAAIEDLHGDSGRLQRVATGDPAWIRIFTAPLAGRMPWQPADGRDSDKPPADPPVAWR